MDIVDEYLTLSKPSAESLFKEKGSKFFGYAFPVSSEDEVKEIISTIKKQHHSARHWCYAWKLGVEKVRFRVNDDGEPSNSAGQPIYGQISSFDITNVLIVVVRYFGGVKLGVGGLVKAYKTSAQITLEASEIVKRNLEEEVQLIFDYPHMNKIMRVIKQMNLSIQEQKMTLNCELILSVKKSEVFRVKEVFEKMHFLRLK